MTAVVIFDMLPSAILYNGVGKALGRIAVGLMLMVWGDFFLGTRKSGSRSLLGLGYLIMLGIALHDLPEGMAIALGDIMKNRTGMVIALGIGIHNIPEGMAIAVPLVMAGVKTPRILANPVAQLDNTDGHSAGHNLNIPAALIDAPSVGAGIGHNGLSGCLSALASGQDPGPAQQPPRLLAGHGGYPGRHLHMMAYSHLS